MQITVTKTNLRDPQQASDLAFWLAQSVQARIDALETLRTQNSQGQPHVDARLQKVCRITQLKPG
jgi:hypothetical protein